VKVGFIAYDANHLKSDQVLNHWYASASAAAIQRSNLFLVPFKSRPSRETFFAHRPDQKLGGHPRDIARHMGIAVEYCESTAEIPSGMDIYIVLGVGLLPDEFVENNCVINAHPGLIPYSRGLDSFKWAIYNHRKVGVTLHRLSPEVDMGSVWIRSETPILRRDTLDSFARRHYELEIGLLSRFDIFIGKEPQPVDPSEAVSATRRMPTDKEQKLWDAFEGYKRQYAE
jgi:phosphoribosylglycinamide formyltransferase-1